jgi:predicted PurR-regulated permease PerM
VEGPLIGAEPSRHINPPAATAFEVNLHSDLGRSTLAILFIVGLIAACLWIVRPFLPAVIWAATLVIATWPIMRRVEAGLWDSRALAVTAMTCVLLLVFVAPFWLAIGTILANSGQIVDWMEAVRSMEFPPPPAWLGDVPIVGTRAVQAWQKVEETSRQEILQQAKPYAGMLTEWFIGAVGGFGMVLLQFLLTVAIAAIMYAQGERAAAAIVRFGNRLAGERGRQSVVLAGQAIRGVALGVVVTAFIQSAIGSVALAVADVPYTPILCAIMFMLCIAQLGPSLVLIPAVIWMFVNGSTLSATFLLICSVVAITADNILRPFLIRKGVDLPLLLILVGVIGGLVAFGLIGIFLGPTVLAIGYTLLEAWVAEGDEAPSPHKETVKIPP